MSSAVVRSHTHSDVCSLSRSSVFNRVSSDKHLKNESGERALQLVSVFMATPIDMQKTIMHLYFDEQVTYLVFHMY